MHSGYLMTVTINYYWKCEVTCPYTGRSHEKINKQLLETLPGIIITSFITEKGRQTAKPTEGLLDL